MLTVCPMLSLKVFMGTEGPNMLQPTPRSLQNKRNPLPTILTYNCLSDQGSMVGSLSQLFQMKSTQQAPRSFISTSCPPEPIPKPVRHPLPHMIWSMLSTAISHSFIVWHLLTKYSPISPQPLQILNRDASAFQGRKNVHTWKLTSLSQLSHLHWVADGGCSAGEDIV